MAMYEPQFYDIGEGDRSRTFMGYVRENGDVGIRNDVWIVVTVGCVNKVAEAIAKQTGALYFTHPVGAPVPTVKIATNHSIAMRKPSWIDFDASPTLESDPLTNELFEYII